jgi:hypothetical protein
VFSLWGVEKYFGTEGTGREFWMMEGRRDLGMTVIQVDSLFSSSFSLGQILLV